MLADFSSKLNFEPKQVKFIEKTYTLKTDHKTGLLIQALFKNKTDEDIDDKLLVLALGDAQYKELMAELEAQGEAEGKAMNYMENKNAIVFGVMATMFNKPYEEFEKAAEEAGITSKN